MPLLFKPVFIRKSFLLASLLLLAQFLMAQTPLNFDAQWKKVEALRQKGLPQSALKEVALIYTEAKKRGADAQLIKAVLYRQYLQRELREEATASSIKELEAELAGAKEPVASLLKSMLAGQYRQLFEELRWKLYDRTATTAFVKEDPLTWSADDFGAVISRLYLQSLAAEELLKKTTLAAYDPILIKGNSRHLRPTLYDLLAQEALEYFKSGNQNGHRPEQSFEITDSIAFAPAAVFARHRFITSDTTSLEYKALLIYQKLLLFHAGDAAPDAFIDADLQRLLFVYQKYTGEGKEEGYEKALQAIITRWGAKPATTETRFELASFYASRAGKYNAAGDTTNRYDYTKAKAILLPLIADSAVKNSGWASAFNLWQTIQRPQFSFQLEKVNLPGQPFRSLIEYRNVPGLQFRIIPLDDRVKNLLENGDEKDWKAIQAISPIRNWQQPLPQTADYQQHSVEIKVDALPLGSYLLLASYTVGRESISGAQAFHVSGISYVGRGNQFFVLHRQTGGPLSGAQVQTAQRQYDYNLRRYQRKTGESYTTDNRGFFQLAGKTDRGNGEIYLDIRYKGDRLNTEDAIYQRYYSSEREEKKEAVRVHFFTDRSLYRPGQVVYFKGIVTGTKKEARLPQILKTFSGKAALRDANYTLIDSLAFTTNEWGSFTGQFVLPASGLTGAFTLLVENAGSTVIRVEEYKRPRFYVEFKKVEATYKLGDSVTLTGTAQGYAGNSVEGAAVKYSVVRQPRFPYPWLFWRGWMPPSPAQQIANGVATTDKDGNFRVTFKALPDRTIDPKLEPLFEYKVVADVTDINGESRTGETGITAGYKSLLLQVSFPERMERKETKRGSIRVSTLR